MAQPSGRESLLQQPATAHTIAPFRAGDVVGEPIALIRTDNFSCRRFAKVFRIQIQPSCFRLRCDLILLQIELTPVPGKREEIIELLQFSVDRLRTKPGCLSSGVYEACNDQRSILYLERWKSEDELHRHIQSNLYLAVLNVLDLAAEPPDISFNVIAETKSMELITALRSPGLPA